MAQKVRTILVSDLSGTELAEDGQTVKFESGAPGIALTDNRGRSRAVLGFLPEEGGTLAFADEQGNTRAVLGLTGAQGASLAFLDAVGSTRASFGIDETGEPSWAVSEGRSATPDSSVVPNGR